MGSVRVRVDISGIQRKFSESNINRGKYLMLSQMIADMDKFVPKKRGILRTTAGPLSNMSGIEYTQKYAGKQFHVQHSNYTTPGTGPRWDLKAKGMYMPNWIKAFIVGASL